MTFCIYKGDIYEIKSQSSTLVLLYADLNTIAVPFNTVVMIPENVRSKVETEIISVRDEISSLTARIQRLDDAYSTKKEALRWLMADARKKEIAVVARVLSEYRKDVEL